MRYLLGTAILTILSLSFNATGQSQYSQAIKSNFDKVQSLGEIDPEDFDSEEVVKYTYPPLIELMGGKDQYIKVIQSTMELGDDTEDDEYYDDEEDIQSTTKIAKIGTVYNTGQELQSVIEVHDLDTYSEGDTEVYKRYQLAISRDNGNFWYFIDGTLNWSKVVPNLHEAIVQPENE